MLTLLDNNYNNIVSIDGTSYEVCNLEAELAILGGILLDPTAISRIVKSLKPEMFYNPVHSLIYSTCLELHKSKSVVDLMTVTNRLMDNGNLKRIGGINTLTQLVDRTVSAVNIDRYVDEIVRPLWIKRQGQELGEKIKSISQDRSESINPESIEVLAEQIKKETAEFLSIINEYCQKDDPVSELDNYLCNQLVEKIRTIQLKVKRPDHKSFLMRKLAGETGFSKNELLDLFYKSMIPHNCDESLTLKELKERYGTDYREWLLHGFIPKGSTTLFHALGGVGKTRFLYHLIYHLVTGENFGDFTVVNPCKVLVIQSDEQPVDIIASLERRGFYEDEYENLVVNENLRIKTTWSSELITQLYEEVEREKYDFILIDSLSSVNRYSMVDENGVEFAKPILLLNEIARDFKTSICLIHHSARAGNARGSTAIYNAVSQVIKLFKKENAPVDDPNIFLSFEKSRARRPDVLKFEHIPESGQFIYQGTVSPPSDPEYNESASSLIVKLLREHKGQMFKNSDIQYYFDSLGNSFNINTIRKTASKLFHDGQINSKKVGKINYYFIGQPAEETLLNVTKCNKSEADHMADQMVDHMVDHIEEPHSSNEIATCDPLIHKKSNISEKNIEKNVKNADQWITSAENKDSERDSEVIHHVIHPDQTDHLTDQLEIDERPQNPSIIPLKEYVVNKDYSRIGIVKEYFPLTNSYQIEWEITRSERTGEATYELTVEPASELLRLNETD